MKFLNPLFQIHAYVPMRQNVSVDINLADNKQFFIIKDGALSTEKVKLTVVKSCLKLLYAIFLPNLKERWLSSIAALGFKRNLQLVKGTYITVPTGALSARISNAYNFGVLPQSLVLFMTNSAAEFGNWSDTRFVYKHNNVSSLRVFRSGQPIELNREYGNLDLKYLGSDHMFLYDQMVQMFGANACHETVDSFFEEFFLFCIPLARNPRVENDHGVMPLASQRTLSFGEAGTIDVDVIFSKPLEAETILHLNGYFDVMFQLNEFGEIITDTK